MNNDPSETVTPKNVFRFVFMFSEQQSGFFFSMGLSVNGVDIHYGPRTKNYTFLGVFISLLLLKTCK